ncbi:DUF2613 domain-containing protein [Rhodococcus pyridinivorans]|jgi:hypothetical protein|uniref:Protein of uncharacterized function (DUF2613) n=8 Tax=Rhodococcus TaxID=1827 RepID=A0A379LZN9_9NOCA|nr:MULTISPECIES: DUF2613 domain-containing protein [Rhodococcus]AHD21252.1 hypothetical protein Y013_11520 [Rhodococcus pyridinivorans SB3094]AWZ26565.1 DUF2613 domain-containing protein [Rhodococcus pyridinivorans]AYA24005.1 DUF2613 family protein [Rhodococcus rhodochrous]EHK83028.1 hypothetical protein AK37_13619 [Rhodococcus pyridinivorans AK37]MBF4480037.1 DUF2613 domain-containing protein [Rhodococcus rhodochrous]
MGKFLGPGLGSVVVGAVLGAVAVFGVTAAVQENSRPQIDRSGNADSSLLNQVEYGSR